MTLSVSELKPCGAAVESMGSEQPLIRQQNKGSVGGCLADTRIMFACPCQDLLSIWVVAGLDEHACNRLPRPSDPQTRNLEESVASTVFLVSIPKDGSIYKREADP